MSSKKKKKKKQKQRRIVRTLSVILTVVILVSCTVAAFSLFGGADRINAQPSEVEDKGLIRVYLKSLSSCQALGLTLDGVYTVDGDAGFRFQRGTEIAVAEDAGDIYLSAGGLTVNMGSSFTLVRQAPGEGKEPGGIYIHEALKDNLYAGDLKLTAEKGYLSAVCTVQVEDYLYGVVGYEMSDSFPMEALKAQAIAARTYAMNAKTSSRAYDVTDTTQDQVYRGFNPAQTRVIRAVDETRGIVLGTNARSFGQCYFTASNGGQIASTKQIWGGTVSYIEMKDDPYDLENPSSVVKSAFLAAEPAEDDSIARAILEKISVPGAEQLRVDRIVNMTLSDPDTQGSLMYKTVTFEVNVSEKVWIVPEEDQIGEELPPDGSEPETDAEGDTDTAETGPDGVVSEDTAPVEATAIEATVSEATPAEATASEATPVEAEPQPVLSDWQSVEGSFTVKLSTYNYLKNALNLSINSAAYEVFDLTSAKDGWTLTARRFGHGVGMSQRGAQTMADKYDKSCEEILAFYYPGLKAYAIDWQENALVPISDLPESLGYARARPTPHPTQAPLPTLRAGEYTATVSLQSSASSLNVRSEPNTSCSVVALLYHGEKVIVTGEYEGGWVGIRTAEFKGYVKSDYLKK